MRTESEYTKTSLYLKNDIKEKIQELIPGKSQSDFINEVTMQALKNMEEERSRKNLLKSLKSIKKVTRKTTARQTLEKLRKEREEVLFRTNKKTKK